MRVRSTKSKAMVLNQKRVECILRVEDEAEEFKYLGMFFTSDGQDEGTAPVRCGKDGGMPPGHLLVTSLWRFFGHIQLEKGPRVRFRSCWRDYKSLLPLECLEIPQKELESVADVWVSLLNLLPV